MSRIESKISDIPSPDKSKTHSFIPSIYKNSLGARIVANLISQLEQKQANYAEHENRYELIDLPDTTPSTNTP